MSDGQRLADEGDAMKSQLGRNRRPPSTFTSNVANRCRARSATTLAMRLSRWALAIAAITALAACEGDGESLTGRRVL